tara:strand:- start:1587 stop:1865 length:279 start_codon:yes stop_codon:yes gene_type:complete
MGSQINWLSRLPQKEQERILGQMEKLVKLERLLSNAINDEDEVMMAIEDEDDAAEGTRSVPIEINGKKYWVDKEVMFLIESLHKQLSKSRGK